MTSKEIIQYNVINFMNDTITDYDSPLERFKNDLQRFIF